MSAKGKLSKKLGPLKLYQWAILGVGAGGLIYLLTRHSGSTESQESTLGPVGTQGAGGAGGGSLEPLPPLEVPTPPAEQIGAIGPIGEPGPPGANPSAALEELPGEVSQINSRLKALEHAQAPKASNHAFPLTNSKTGEKYKVVREKNGRVVHVYKSGKKVVVKGSQTHAQRQHAAQKHAVNKQQRSRVGNPRANHPRQVAANHHTKPTPLHKRVNLVQPRAHIEPQHKVASHPVQKPTSHPAKPQPKKKAKKR